MGKTDERIAELGLELPSLRAPIGDYASAVRSGNLLFLAGHGPVRNGERTHIGKAGSDFTLEEAKESARITALNAITTLKSEVGDLDNITRIVKVLCFVNSAPGFTDQPSVMDAASTLFREVFGDRGRHARTAVGTHELPFGLTTEIELIAEVAPDA